MRPGNIAIIGGTGFSTLPPEIYAEEVSVETTAGTVSLLSVSNNYVEPYKLYFLPRHGRHHRLAPHQIDYRANVLALQKAGVAYAFATNAVGSLRRDLPPGTLIVLDDFIDFTRARPLTLFTRDGPWEHVDFTEPYSTFLRERIIAAASRMGVPVLTSGIYLCCDGPRYETPAEVRLFARMGADVVGMTGLPEAVLAREAGIAYAALAIVTNLAAGLSPAPVSHDTVTAVMQQQAPVVRELLICAAEETASYFS
ncbi:MAG: S-methyl-5'-thioinosine phosphorylase [Chloroherpetonaceae bacterium]|nr:S-methyl-5'-thioinosine phosphorylase [Chthonomonadaceae bacterium]MDW8208293.1 S-methyl-5'-thioinosine phosphorylase [Chloroherpetonaceae bacterium]